MGNRKKKEPVARPWSIGPCPTADELRAVWRKRRASSRDFIAFLSVLGELTCYADCNLRHLGGFGNIAGRAGGLKAFLAESVPDLLPKYKTISRYATLVARFKKAFDYYPPAALSLMHPDLPLPKRNYPFMTNFAQKVYRNYFANVPPTYAAYAAVVAAREKRHTPRYKWGPAWPHDAWRKVEREWVNRYARPKIRAMLRYMDNRDRDWGRWDG